jgi:hypothetical protein
MINNAISTDCQQATTGGGTGGTDVPEPGSLVLLGGGFFGLLGVMGTKRRHWKDYFMPAAGNQLA